MTGARIVVVVAVKETVGLGVPPGAEFVDDGVGEPVAEGRVVEEKDGVDDCEGVFDAEAPRERVEEGVCVDVDVFVRVGVGVCVALGVGADDGVPDRVTEAVGETLGGAVSVSDEEDELDGVAHTPAGRGSRAGHRAVGHGVPFRGQCRPAT